MKRKKNRAERTHTLLRRRWASSMDIIREVGTVKPTNCISELRDMGVLLKCRRVDGITQYRVA